MRKTRTVGFVLVLVAILAYAAGAGSAAQQPKLNKLDAETARKMLRDAYDAVKRYYYDPKYHGLNLDARLEEYDARIQNAGSFGQAFGVIAAFLEGLKDSHTFFNPPSRASRLDYGYRMQMIGDNCFVTRVRPSTDAESKVHPGDRVVTYDGFDVNRSDFHSMQYYFGVLAPQPASKLGLRDPAGSKRELIVDAKVAQLKKVMDLTASGGGTDIWDLVRQEENEDHVIRERMVETADVAIWKMPEFFLRDSEVDGAFGSIRKHKTLILDLRGNPGGAIVTLARVVGNVFDHDIKIADRVGRKESKPQVAKTIGSNAFAGKLIVLVDSGSASASEVFARIVQIEHRGTVIGDRTAGAVMEARHYPYSEGVDTKVFYGFSVTDADLIMTDGKSLENTGVTPDETILPTAQDLAAGRDPALARAVELAGSHLDATEAGKLFPFEWVRL